MSGAGAGRVLRTDSVQELSRLVAVKRNFSLAASSDADGPGERFERGVHLKRGFIARGEQQQRIVYRGALKITAGHGSNTTFVYGY